MATIKNEPLFVTVETNLIQLSDNNCNAIFENLQPDIKRIIIKTVFELNRAIAKHPEWPADHIHQAAIVAEESGELVRAALQQYYEGGQYMEMYTEAKQTAAMGLRMMLNLTKTATNETH
jgi:hypothetical protein